MIRIAQTTCFPVLCLCTKQASADRPICFVDEQIEPLVVTRFKAGIYQYVGDEAALTWKQEERLADHNCLRAFFKFEERLQHKAAV